MKIKWTFLIHPCWPVSVGASGYIKSTRMGPVSKEWKCYMIPSDLKLGVSWLLNQWERRDTVNGFTKKDLISSLCWVIHEALIRSSINAFSPYNDGVLQVPLACLFWQSIAKKRVPQITQIYLTSRKGGHLFLWMKQPSSGFPEVWTPRM